MDGVCVFGEGDEQKANEVRESQPPIQRCPLQNTSGFILSRDPVYLKNTLRSCHHETLEEVLSLLCIYVFQIIEQVIQVVPWGLVPTVM